MIRSAAVVLLSGLIFINTTCAQTPATSMARPEATATAEFNGMVDQYFDGYFHFHPTEATYAGFHQYDGELAVGGVGAGGEVRRRAGGGV